MCITFQKIEDRDISFVSVLLSFADDIEDYTISITGIIGCLNLSESYPGDDDICLVTNAIEESLSEKDPPKSGTISMVLEESGEWQGMSWLKYFIVKRRLDSGDTN